MAFSQTCKPVPNKLAMLDLHIHAACNFFAWLTDGVLCSASPTTARQLGLAGGAG